MITLTEFKANATYENLLKLRKDSLKELADELSVALEDESLKSDILTRIVRHYVDENIWDADDWEKWMKRNGKKEKLKLEQLKLEKEKEMELEKEKLRVQIERERIAEEIQLQKLQLQQQKEKEEQDRLDRLAREENERKEREIERQVRLAREQADRDALAAERDAARVANEEKERADRQLKEKLELARIDKGLSHGGKPNDFDPLKISRNVKPFNETDLDRYFVNFEKQANQFGWPSDQWAAILSNKLTGKAEGAYNALTQMEAEDYDVLKQAVLDAYELVPEAYRRQFREHTKSSTETYVEFAHDSLVKFERWIKSEEVNDFNSLQHLILIDNFKRHVSEEIRVHLGEKKPRSLKDAARLADEFALNHKKKFGSSEQKKSFPGSMGNKRTSGSVSKPSAQQMAGGAKHSTDGNKSSGGKNNQNTPYKRPYCTYCHKDGHWRNKCFKLPENKQVLVMTTKDSKRSCKTKREKILSQEVPAKLKPFVCFGYVDQKDNFDRNKPVPVTILRDTVATQSILVGGVLPLGQTRATRRVLVRGYRGSPRTVSIYEIRISCPLIDGVFEVGVTDQLTVPGVCVILGNDILGDRVGPMTKVRDSGKETAVSNVKKPELYQSNSERKTDQGTLTTGQPVTGTNLEACICTNNVQSHTIPCNKAYQDTAPMVNNENNNEKQQCDKAHRDEALQEKNPNVDLKIDQICDEAHRDEALKKVTPSTDQKKRKRQVKRKRAKVNSSTELNQESDKTHGDKTLKEEKPSPDKNHVCSVTDEAKLPVKEVVTVKTHSMRTRSDVQKEKSEVPNEQVTVEPETEVPTSNQPDLNWKKSILRSDLIHFQKEEPEFKKAFQQVVDKESLKDKDFGFYVENQVLMRKWKRKNDSEHQVRNQIMLPTPFREKILEIAHDSLTGGHLGVEKTEDRILRQFFWPKLQASVKEYCRTCHKCQLVGKPNQGIPRAPLKPIPVMGEAFSTLIIDCVGPLPQASSGKEYIFTIMCANTRYPDAIPLKSIKAPAIIKALEHFFTTYGIPRVIQSDQGSNFTSKLFQAELTKLGIKHQISSAYHAQSQGALERFHGTLKGMLRKYVDENARDWDKNLHWLMFAIRLVVQSSLGFSPFELVFGHEVREPLKVLKEATLNEPGLEGMNTLNYVNQFHIKLKEMCKMAQKNLGGKQIKMKQHYDQATKKREFFPGDEVVILIPVKHHPLAEKFSGPYKVKEKVNDLNYVIETPDRRKTQQLCHVNMIRKYHPREPESIQHVLYNVSAEGDSTLKFPMADIELKNSEVLNNLEEKLSSLTKSQIADMTDLFNKYHELFPDVPRRTDQIIHDVDVGDSSPMKQHPYRVNKERSKLIEKEIHYMLENGIIKKSKSAWSSPCVLVEKSDGGVRFCTDYRKVNSVTKADSYPIPRIDDLIDKVGNSKFVTKCDLLKGYWCVPLSKRAKEISAFSVASGLYEYQVMPFGMRNAPATFQRLINEVIHGLENVMAYLDDLLMYSDTWEEHIQKLDELFSRLSRAKLTMNLRKSEFGKTTVTYLGFQVGMGQVAPLNAKVQAIADFPPPKTVKGVRRFLGMVGYYRRFCPFIRETPLTDLLRKNKKFKWNSECNDAFEKVKHQLLTAPILKAPDFSKPFKLAVDASNVGMGAVLLQEDENHQDFPVSYYSKKFNRHQLNYSTTEQELLAIILAIQHFEVYVNSRERLIIFTDHNPLTFLQTHKNKNKRLLSWSLQLQEYNICIQHIKGKENVIADCLSRME